MSKDQERSIWLEAIDRASAFLGFVISRFADRWVIISGIWAIVAFQAMQIWSLPEDERSEHLTTLPQLVGAFERFAGSSTFAFVGWSAFVVTLLIASGVIYLQRVRIREQGGELAAFRDSEDPTRPSSRDPAALMQYHETAVAKYGTGDNADG